MSKQIDKASLDLHRAQESVTKYQDTLTAWEIARKAVFEQAKNQTGE